MGTCSGYGDAQREASPLIPYELLLASTSPSPQSMYSAGEKEGMRGGRQASG